MRTVNLENHARQRARILDTACSQFARHGYNETSLDAIARACRMKKPSLYHYFRNKQSLLKELVKERVIEMHQKVVDLHKGVLGGPYKTLLRIARFQIAQTQQPRTRDFVYFLVRHSMSDAFVRKVFLAESRRQIEQIRERMWPGHAGCASDSARQMLLYQFNSCVRNYVVEAKILKVDVATKFIEKDYLESLAKIFAYGLKGCRRKRRRAA